MSVALGSGWPRQTRRCAGDLFLRQRRHAAVRPHRICDEPAGRSLAAGPKRFPPAHRSDSGRIQKERIITQIADDIRRGLLDAIAYAEGTAETAAYRVHVPQQIDVKAIRAGLAMTQQEFAARFGFSVNTLRHWEQGSRQPEGPTRAYLRVIERAPQTVQAALRAA